MGWYGESVTVTWSRDAHGGSRQRIDDVLSQELLTAVRAIINQDRYRDLHPDLITSITEE